MKAATFTSDSLVACTDWMWMTLMRLGRTDEAGRLLEPIHSEMLILENGSYLDRLLMYRGEKPPTTLLPDDPSDLDLATYGFGLGHWHLLRGEKDQARRVFLRVTEGPYWAAFGYIAAEAELHRMSR